MAEFLKAEIEGSILTITLARPQILNSLNGPACCELDALLTDFAADPSLRVAILTGEGRAFCAGHDLADDPAQPLPANGWAGLSQRRDLAKPLIAAVNGLAYGGGFEIVLACDIVIADPSARFALTEPRIGGMALGGGIQRAMRRMPSAVAMGMLLSGRPIDAAQAYQWGVVNEVAPPGEVLDTARDWAQDILACGPFAVAETKRLALAVLEGDAFIDAIGSDRRALLPHLHGSAENMEGIAAFLDKRPPVWSGSEAHKL
jgi:enoyl-CoA hydratase/carnithine racemase